jgi:2-dehydropantoate 2-reductase
VTGNRIEPIVVAGAGALGSIYGGMLAVAGYDVVLLARGGHERALGRGELEIRLPDGTRRASVRVSERAAGRTVILTSRLFDSDAVLDRVEGGPALAISFQNGLGKNDALIRRFGAERVAPAVSTLAAELVSPGVVESVDLGRTLVEARGSEAPALVRALEDAGVPSQVADDGRSAEWSKLAQVTAAMGLQAVTRRFLHELLLAEDGAALFAGMCREVAALAAAEGVSLGDWPSMPPVRTIAESAPDEAIAILRSLGERMLAQGITTRRTSLLRAAEAGRRTELDGIHGELIRRGIAEGVALPVVEAVFRLARLQGVRA